MNEKWFSFSTAEIEQKLKTNAASGLSRKAARSAWYRERRQSANSHTLFIRKSKSARKMFKEVISDFALIILVFAALLAVLFDDRAMGAVVILLSLFSVAISFAFYLRSQRAMEKINLYFLPTAKVIRGGKLYRIGFENVVKGDVIILEKGDVACADARLITSDDLTVIMRTNQKEYITLKKQAHGAVLPEENNPAKMVNIIHAGSVIESGSARAVVYATGEYTYLGALTGGISEFYSDNTPSELKKLKKICSQINMFSMLAILPFCVLSLIFSHIGGGTATLSATFLTALAISASSMSQLACTICKVFFIKKIKTLSQCKNPAVIRTTDAFDRLSGVDYLFLLDGSAQTDGVLHFDTAFNCEGEIKSFVKATSTTSALLEMAGIYNSAECNALTLGINLPQRFKVGLEEFLKLGTNDTEALKIRYPIRSYMPGTNTNPVDRVFFSDKEKNMVLDVSRTSDVFSQCSHALASGSVQQLTSVGMDKLKHTYNLHASKGKTVLVFTLSTLENSGNNFGKLFVGAVVLREKVDTNAFRGVSALAKKGVKTVSFVGCMNDENIPQIPVEAHFGVKVSKEQLQKNNTDITYGFGEIDTYYGYNLGDVAELIRLAHTKEKSVGVISFSDSAAAIANIADVFISCSPIINVFTAKSEEELYTLELAGAADSTSCIQTVKEASDVIIERPNGSKGGLLSIANALNTAQTAYRNLNSFFKYLICSELIMILVTGIPMAFGKPILDARHVLLCSFIINIFVMLILSDDKKNVPHSNIEQYKIKSLKAHISSNKSLILTVVGASLSAIVIPMIMDIIGVFGHYLYKVEFSLFSVLWLHLTLAYYVRYTSVSNVRYALKNKKMIALFIGVAVFAFAISIIAPFGLLLEFESLPLTYFVASFLPSVIFAVITELLPRRKNLK